MQNYYTKNFKYFAMASGAVVVIALIIGIIMGGMNIGIDFAGAVKFIGNSFADNKEEGTSVKPFGGNRAL